MTKVYVFQWRDFYFHIVKSDIPFVELLLKNNIYEHAHSSHLTEFFCTTQTFNNIVKSLFQYYVLLKRKPHSSYMHKQQQIKRMDVMATCSTVVV